MPKATTQSAARFLDERCAQLQLQAHIVIEGTTLVVYGENRAAFRRAHKILPRQWRGHTVVVRKHGEKI